MGPLQQWLGALELAEFREHYLGREPLAGSGSARSAVASCNWKRLHGLLKAQPKDVLVVSRGQLLDAALPRSLQQLRGLFSTGAGVAIRSAERQCSQLSTLCSAFARELPGEQRVIVFATPGGTHGFGWHYDAEDVFVVQTAGDKEYFFRRNTMVPSPDRGVQPDFGAYRYETTPIMSCRLVSGDWLYIPRGFWHVAYAHRHSLSLSVGVFPE